MRFHKIYFLFAIAFVFNNADAQFRKYSNEFLNIGAGARGLGMGNAQIVSSKDATSGYWNPANLVGLNNPNLALMHANYFSGIANYDFIAAAFPSKDKTKALGFTLLRFGVDDIPNTLYLVEPDGSINYNNIQTFSSADYAFLFSFAQKLKETEKSNLSFGANAKIIHRKVGSFATAWGFGLDAGIKYGTPKWQIAAMARDISTTFNAWKFNFTEREKEVFYLTNNDIPVRSSEMTMPRLIIGGNYKFQLGKNVSLSPELNLDLTFDGQQNSIVSSKAINVDPRFGLEADIKNAFYIRAGISNFQQALKDGDTTNQKKVWIYQPSLGAGFKIKKVNLDYAFTNLANQNNPLYSHIISLSFNLGKNEK